MSVSSSLGFLTYRAIPLALLVWTASARIDEPGAQCSARLEAALQQAGRRMRNSQDRLFNDAEVELGAPGRAGGAVAMRVMRMRVRAPARQRALRVTRCAFDPRNASLHATLLFNDLSISGHVTPVGMVERPYHRDYGMDEAVARNLPPDDYDGGYGGAALGPGGGADSAAAAGCNMILRLRKAGIAFHTQPLHRAPGRFNVKTDSEFAEPGFISVYAYGCDHLLARPPARPGPPREKRSDEFHFEGPSEEERLDYERSEFDDGDDVTREMEDVFAKGMRSLLTLYMKRQLQPAIKETLMRNMGYVVSYGK